MPTYSLRGIDGLDQAKWWDENRLQAYEGVSVPGFPNHFSIFGPYGYNGSSYFALIEAQTGHIVRCLNHAPANHSDRRSQISRAFQQPVAWGPVLIMDDSVPCGRYLVPHSSARYSGAQTDSI